MKFRATLAKNALSAEQCDILHVMHALQRYRRSDHSDSRVVLRLAPDNLSLARRIDATDELYTQNTFQVDRLFSEYRIESKRANLIDLEVCILDLLRFFQLCARSEQVVLSLSTDDDSGSPVLKFSFVPSDFPGDQSTWCNGYFSVRVLQDEEILRIHSLEGPQEEKSIPSGILKRMHSERIFTDAQIIAGGDSIPVHRAVVAAASPVLKRMLESGMQEGQHSRVVLANTGAKAAGVFVDFMYGLPVPKLSVVDLIDLISLAHFYDLRSLMELCMERMIRADNLEDALAFMKHALKFREDPVFEDAVHCLSLAWWNRVIQDQNLFHAAVFKALTHEVVRDCPSSGLPSPSAPPAPSPSSASGCRKRGSPSTSQGVKRRKTSEDEWGLCDEQESCCVQ